jgi:hypothetical protein
MPIMVAAMRRLLPLRHIVAAVLATLAVCVALTG